MATYTYDENPQETKQFFYVLAKLSSVSPATSPNNTNCADIEVMKTAFGTNDVTTDWVLLGALEDFNMNTEEEEAVNDTAGNKIKLSEMVTVEMTDLSQNYTALRGFDRKSVDYMVIDPSIKDGSNNIKYTQVANVITSVLRSLTDNKWNTKVMAERKAINIDDFVTEGVLA